MSLQPLFFSDWLYPFPSREGVGGVSNFSPHPMPLHIIHQNRHHIINISHHLFIFEAQDFDSQFIQISFFFFIFSHRFFIMMRQAVEFYCQTELFAVEIDDVAANRFLPDEADTQLFPFQVFPQADF